MTPVPDRRPHDRHLHDVRHVDEAGRHEVADDRGASPDAHVEVARCLARHDQRVGR